MNDNRLVIKKDGVAVQLLGQLCDTLPIAHSAGSNNATTPEGAPSTFSHSSLSPSSDHSHGARSPTPDSESALDDDDTSSKLEFSH